ncbi:MAG: cell division protein FtsZ [Clostridiales bacterium]|nr:cell division protein FtsZ [Clostridiales bacterium]
MNYKDLQAGIAANVKAEVTSPVKIAIIGVGGGGSNAVDNMVKAKLKVETFMAINTDLQALRVSKATKRIQIGSNLTKGFGAGADAEKGKKAAEESKETLVNLIKDMDLVFITAGMGGGTGTGAAPVIAEIAQSLGKLTVAFVTTPFLFEGPVRMRNAQMGIANLRKYVDSIVIISNERLLSVAKDLTIQKAFAYADDVLRQGVQAITDLIMNPNTINVDFADVCNVLKNGGDAVMGIGQANGTNRAVAAVQKAVNNSVLGMTIEGASKVIINIEGGTDALIDENARAVEIVRSICDKDVEIIYGTGTVPALQDSIQVTIIATGFKRPFAPGENNEAKPTVQQPTVSPQPQPVPPLNLFGDQAPQSHVPPPAQPTVPPPPVAPSASDDNSGKISLSDAEMNWWKRLNNK